MFFSWYASFRWAGTEQYVLKIAVFTIVASLLSAQVFTLLFGMLGFDTFAILFWWLGGLASLSFPFYYIWGESRIPLPSPHIYSQWIPTYEIRVPPISVLQLVPQGLVERALNGEGLVNVLSYRVVFLEMEIGSVPSDAAYVIGTVFLFFMVVNVVGALLGFAMSKIPMDKLPKIDRIKWDSIGLFLRVLFGAIFVAVGLWFSTIGKVFLTGPVSGYYHSYNPNLYIADAFVCLVFGIVWLAIVVAEEKIL